MNKNRTIALKALAHFELMSEMRKYIIKILATYIKIKMFFNKIFVINKTETCKMPKTPLVFR